MSHFLHRLAPPLALAAALTASACDSDPCEDVTCAEGATCSPDDGMCHCGALDGPVCGADEVCAAGSMACVPGIPDAVCSEGTRWAPGQPAFREATAEWGLAEIGARGVRLSVTDVDGDGWADLEVRRGAGAIDDFSDPSSRRTWLMRNTGDGTFEDVTESSGLLTRRNGPGGRPVEIVAWGDVDNDGDLDVYTGLGTADWDAVGMETSEILLNDGSGHFELTADTNPVRRPDDVDAPAGASFVDVDHDGWLDLWVPEHNYSTGSGGITLQNDRLWRGDGSGRFEDVTDAMGLTTEDWSSHEVLNMAGGHTRAWSANACDLSGDGYAELLASSYGRSPNHLWQARPGGDGVAFENRSVASGYAYDDDLTWDDNQFARCYCQSNPSAEGCADVPAPVVTCAANWNHGNDRQPWRLGGNSGATICGDLDNDGDLDLLTTEIRHWWAGSGSDGSEVLVNDGGDDPVFSRPGDEALGLAVPHDGPTWDEGHMTGAIFDFDNDGWPDIYIGASDYAGNRGLLYQNQGGEALAFVEVPPADGIEHNRSHGVVHADFDRDGDLDVVVGHSRARCDASAPNDCYETGQVRFFENLAGDGGNFVQLTLEGGEGTNRAAIGARVRVTAGDLTQTQEVGGGFGHYGSQNDLTLHFGLGGACEAEVEIRWPDGELTTETYTLPAGHRFHVRQGGPPVPVE
ncbi:MAG TPA: CRTAC1 family protein [Sandaracinaceae bacterium LLY-WYZ-13_1]|nr:CRTAC1 family protein [Sandaracinaceae bacterium LLY-WYZ-13_1]